MELRAFLDKLREEKRLITVEDEVSTKFEIAAFLRDFDGRAIYFPNVKGYDMPIVGGLCSSRELIAGWLGCTRNKTLFKLVNALENPKPYDIVTEAPCQEIDMGNDLTKLPHLWQWGEDRAPYIASSVVLAKDPEFGCNMSIHRMMVRDPESLIIRICQRDLYDYLERAGGELDVAIAIGNNVGVLLAEAMRVPKDVDELTIANSIHKTDMVKAKTVDVLVPADAEIVIEGKITQELDKEGPFVELTGKYDNKLRDQPVIKVNKITTRKDPIYQALLGGSLEHKLLMGLPREPTIFWEVNKAVDCKNVSITPGGCSWLHAVVQIAKKNEDDGKKAIEAAFKGHGSLKHCWVVDEDIDLFDQSEVEWAFATRFQGDRDMVVKEGAAGSSLDPSSEFAEGTDRRKTTKIGFDATIPLNKPREDFIKAKAPMHIDKSKYKIQNL